jgi:hypothetical protein
VIGCGSVDAAARGDPSLWLSGRRRDVLEIRVAVKDDRAVMLGHGGGKKIDDARGSVVLIRSSPARPIRSPPCSAHDLCVGDVWPNTKRVRVAEQLLCAAMPIGNEPERGVDSFLLGCRAQLFRSQRQRFIVKIDHGLHIYDDPAGDRERQRVARRAGEIWTAGRSAGCPYLSARGAVVSG